MTVKIENGFTLETVDDVLASLRIGNGVTTVNYAVKNETTNSELPPTYDVATSSRTIPCQVCHEPMFISPMQSGLNEFVVKCNRCHEHTLTRDPPAGRKHLRCQCHALLFHRGTSSIAICPRQLCRKVHNLSGRSMYKVCCVYCSSIFYMKKLGEQEQQVYYAKCLHCKRKSYVADTDKIYSRSWCFVLFAIICFLMGIIVLTVALPRISLETPRVIFGCFTVVPFLMGIGTCIAGLRSRSTKVSIIEETL